MTTIIHSLIYLVLIGSLGLPFYLKKAGIEMSIPRIYCFMILFVIFMTGFATLYKNWRHNISERDNHIYYTTFSTYKSHDRHISNSFWWRYFKCGILFGDDDDTPLSDVITDFLYDNNLWDAPKLIYDSIERTSAEPFGKTHMDENPLGKPKYYLDISNPTPAMVCSLYFILAIVFLCIQAYRNDKPDTIENNFGNGELPSQNN
ncbi:MAG: hypothetical protein ABI723_11725 [Bacteroidia bacterium]